MGLTDITPLLRFLALWISLREARRTESPEAALQRPSPVLQALTHSRGHRLWRLLVCIVAYGELAEQQPGNQHIFDRPHCICHETCSPGLIEKKRPQFTALRAFVKFVWLSHNYLTACGVLPSSRNHT
jgi:hypothetical protein